MKPYPKAWDSGAIRTEEVYVKEYRLLSSWTSIEGWHWCVPELDPGYRGMLLTQFKINFGVSTKSNTVAPVKM